MMKAQIMIVIPPSQCLFETASSVAAKRTLLLLPVIMLQIAIQKEKKTNVPTHIKVTMCTTILNEERRAT